MPSRRHFCTASRRAGARPGRAISPTAWARWWPRAPGPCPRGRRRSWGWSSVQAQANCRRQTRGARQGRAISEVQLQRELDLAHGTRRRGDLTESRYRRRTRTAPPAYAGWTGQYHMVGSVEHLHAELQVPFFGDLELLDDRNIFVPAPRSLQGVAAAVSKRAGYRIGECRRVPPAVLGGIGQNRIDTGSAVEPAGVGNEIRTAGIP